MYVCQPVPVDPCVTLMSTEPRSKMSALDKSMSSSKTNDSFIEYFDGLPSELQEVIKRKLAHDRTSFVAWSFARRSNLKDFKDPSFWKSLIESEGRHVRPNDALKPGKLMNVYYRRCYHGVQIDGDFCCSMVSLFCKFCNRCLYL